MRDAAGTTGTRGGGDDSGGLFRGDGITLSEMAHQDDTAPDGNGNLTNFDNPTLNEAGQVAFRGLFINTSPDHDAQGPKRGPKRCRIPF